MALGNVTVPIIVHEGQVFALTDNGVYHIADCLDE